MACKKRKGSSKMISLYWFAMLVIIAGGIFAMVVTFYGHPYDVRGLEVDILGKKTADCLSKGGELNENLFNKSSGNFSEEFKENFLEECNLNFEDETSKGRSNYYTEILFYEAEEINDSGFTEGSPVFEVRKGNQNWREGCSVEEDYSSSARCMEKRVYSTAPEEIPGKSGKQYLIKIISIVGKVNENVK